MLRKIDRLNQEWEEQGVEHQEDEACVLSLDTEAFYPYLDTGEVASLCGKMVKDSVLQFSWFDHRWARLYIALTCMQA